MPASAIAMTLGGLRRALSDCALPDETEVVVFMSDDGDDVRAFAVRSIDLPSDWTFAGGREVVGIQADFVDERSSDGL